VNWQNALTFVAGINTGTYDCGDTSGDGGTPRIDWRLPNVRELFSLVDFAFFDPPISNAAGTGNATTNDPFLNFAPGIYWSSTTIAKLTGGAWYLTFENGTVHTGSKGLIPGRVTAVRDGF
jgi:hypothetical protein